MSGNITQTCSPGPSTFGRSAKNRMAELFWRSVIETAAVRYCFPPEIVSLILRIREEGRNSTVRTNLCIANGTTMRMSHGRPF
jgi:hypothetical protein